MRDGLIGLLIVIAVGLVIYGCFQIHQAAGFIMAGVMAMMGAGILVTGKFEHEQSARKSR